MAENNPLVKESTLSKIVSKTKKKKKENNIEELNLKINSYLIGMNNAIPVCAEASACCWDKEIPEDYQGIADYVGRRSKTGHTSILEHSNMVVYMSVGMSFTEDLVMFINQNTYLKTALEKSSDGTYWHFLIGGSFRGFSDLYREAKDLNNPILKHITSIIYKHTHVAAFEDLCALGLLDRTMFLNLEPGDDFPSICTTLGNDSDTDLFRIIGIDSLRDLCTRLYNANAEAVSKFSTFDMIKFVTITVLFKNMSRTCTHQLVRHRNAITQESQRYVNYKDSCFSNPATFKPDKYDADHKYRIRFGASGQQHMALEEIGDAICAIYSQLQDPAIAGQKYALLKEDARAFLPSNVQCRKIYMTFTFKSFLKFLNLREDKHAQAEIRMYATAVGDWFRSFTEFNTKELCDLYTNPRLLIEDPFNIDIDQGVEEEVFTMTEEEYNVAAGLDKDEAGTAETD